MTANNRRRPKISHFSPWLVAIFLVFTFGGARAQINTSSEAPWKGRVVFQEKGCTQCHAVFGEKDRAGPDLGKEKFYGTYLEVAALLWNHFPGMSRKMLESGTTFSEFDEQEMSQLISYLAYFRYLGEPGVDFKGKRLLKSKGCVSCHKFGGMGGDIGPDIASFQYYMSPIKLAESLWNHGPGMTELFREHNIKRPEFKGNEIVHLATALRSYMSPTKVSSNDFSFGDPIKGEKLAEEKGCLYCHAVAGTGGSTGPDFTEIDLDYSVTQIAGRMWNHGPAMWEFMENEDIAFPVFEAGGMADVIAYIYGLRLKDAPGDALQGHRIVSAKACLSCHALQGKGADIAGDLAKLDQMDSPLNMIAAMWNHAPAMQDQIQQRKLEWPKLTGRDMANVYAYLDSLAQSAVTKK